MPVRKGSSRHGLGKGEGKESRCYQYRRAPGRDPVNHDEETDNYVGRGTVRCGCPALLVRFACPIMPCCSIPPIAGYRLFHYPAYISLSSLTIFHQQRQHLRGLWLVHLTDCLVICLAVSHALLTPIYTVRIFSISTTLQSQLL